MDAIATVQLTLSDSEQELLAELLQREQSRLPVEIHHTRTAKFREHLKSRLVVVEDIQRRMLSLSGPHPEATGAGQ